MEVSGLIFYVEKFARAEKENRTHMVWKSRVVA